MRSVNDRIAWFRAHPPAKPGMCLNHTWAATDLPWVPDQPDANAGVALVKRNGAMHTDRRPPRGAWVWWTSSTHGHVCLSVGDGRIVSTDVAGRAVGTVDLTYPETQWGHHYEGWSRWYGEPFTVAPTERQRRRRIERLTDRIKALSRRVNVAKRKRERARKGLDGSK